MKASLLLAWRYVSYHKLRSGLLVSCVALIGFLPLAVNMLMQLYESRMQVRAESTPLVIGAPGSRFDLLLSALYFKGTLPRTLPYTRALSLYQEPMATAIPIYQRHSVRQRPLVGTSFDYFSFRSLETQSGRLPAQLGEAVLGARLAADWQVNAGDSVITDTEKLYDISASYPLKLNISGVLKETGTADDWVVFADLKTAWIVSGIGHGHQKVDNDTEAKLVLSKDSDNVTTNASIFEYNEITAANLASFHFHGEGDDWPLTAIIVIPKDKKSRILLKTRFDNDEKLQSLVPTAALAELLQIVFRIKSFFDANLALVLLAATLFMTLIIMLSLKVRERELETLFKIGCSRSTTFRLMSTELALICSTGLSISAIGAAVLYQWIAAGRLI